MRFCCLKVYSFEKKKKKLLRKNFVLIKFSVIALLFEKLGNECKNPLFLHKAGNTPECEPKLRHAEPAWSGSAQLVNAK